MLVSAKSLKGFGLQCVDGNIGTVKDFFFDDARWGVRYLVAATSSWMIGRQVLVSPYALISLEVNNRKVVINLTRQEIEDSPALDNENVVSKQFEQDYHDYYGWPGYWGGPHIWGEYAYLERDPEKRREITVSGKPLNANLRSTDAVCGYDIQASDGKIGHVEDFIIDTEHWAIRYLVVDTKNWWPGEKVLIAPSWIEHISWSEAKVFVNVLRKMIENAPQYTEKNILTRKQEINLHRHYDRTGYWEKEPCVTRKNCKFTKVRASGRIPRSEHGK